MQQLIVILIGIVVFSYVGYQVYKTLRKSNSKEMKCGGCSGCASNK